MAEFDMEFPEDFLSELLNSDFGDIAEEALKEAALILVDEMKSSCKKAIQHEGDSELVNSFKSNKPKRTKTDAWIVNVTPKGISKVKVYHAKGSNNRKADRKYPVSNALKAIWKEYGIAGQQPARPFIANATNNARDRAMEKMQEVYNRKVGADE